MKHADLRHTIDDAFERREEISPKTKGKVRDAVAEALDLLDSGKARVAEPVDDGWAVNEWLKKAVLLSFRLNDMDVIKGGPGDAVWWDKVPSKFSGWKKKDFEKAGFRPVPGCVVRRSAYIAPGAVLMPSFVNLGAYVDEGTMVDTWATVGSCAQIGKNVHLSGGVGIGGVLEPLQAGPVIIEDDCFIGARSEVVEGCHRRQGLGSVDGRLHRPVDQDREPADRRDPHGPGAPLLGGRVGHHPGQAHARRFAGSFALLRRDRQDGRRAHTVENVAERAVAGLGPNPDGLEIAFPEL